MESSRPSFPGTEELSAADEAAIEHIVDTQGLSYEAARAKHLGYFDGQTSSEETEQVPEPAARLLRTTRHINRSGGRSSGDGELRLGEEHQTTVEEAAQRPTEYSPVAQVAIRRAHGAVRDIQLDQGTAPNVVFTRQRIREERKS